MASRLAGRGIAAKTIASAVRVAIRWIICDLAKDTQGIRVSGTNVQMYQACQVDEWLISIRSL